MKYGGYGQPVLSDLLLPYFPWVMVNQPCLQCAPPDRQTLGDNRALTLCKVCYGGKGRRGERWLPQHRRSFSKVPCDPRAHVTLAEQTQCSP